MEAAPLAWYLYAVLPAGAPAQQHGLEPILPGAALITVTEAGLAALTSLVPRSKFSAADPASQATDPGWVAACAAAHHALVAALHQTQDCLPLGFGTLFATQAGLRDWLTQHQAALRAGLQRLAGQAEWGLALHLDQARFTAHAEAHDSALAALQAQRDAASPGTAFLLDKRLDKARQASRGAAFSALACQIEACLRAAGMSVQTEQPAAQDAACWSLLGARGADPAAALAALDAAIGAAGGRARLTGPWPPYAFARAALEAPHG